MQIMGLNGKIKFINDEGVETYKNYLNKQLLQVQEMLKARKPTEEEEKQINELMNEYNQIVDYEKENEVNQEMTR